MVFLAMVETNETIVPPPNSVLEGLPVSPQRQLSIEY